MKENKKWELIAKAHQEYPKGTKVQWTEGHEFEVSGTYKIEVHDSIWIKDAITARTIFDGTNWAPIFTDKPKFILRSEDGVDLYEGDDYCVAHRSSTGDKWALLSFRGDFNYTISTESVCLESERFFSTKEAAEMWCKEQNKPKEVVIRHNDNETSLVSLEKVVISVFDKGYLTRKTYLSIDAIKSIYKAYQSLQEGASCK